MKLIMILVALSLAVVPADAKRKKASDSPEIKYVFYMIGDGMGVNEVHGTQLYNQATGLGPEMINFAYFPMRTFVTTHSASSLVTDSAAGGTALATGTKTYNGAIGVDSEHNPVSNIAEWAKAGGYGVGVASSVSINHATPASFYGHTNSRNDYEVIFQQLIESEVDFAAGSDISAERRRTGHTYEDLIQMAKDAGITVLRSGFENAEEVEGRLLCLSSTDQSALTYAIDRTEGNTSLSDFVDAGIDYLYEKYGDKGFFFMVEGGKIDSAGHGSDAVTMFNEINDFAASIDLVLEFYEQHPDETIIVVTSDHNTGAMHLGAGEYEMHPDRLAYQKASVDVMTGEFRKRFSNTLPDWDSVKSFISEYTGLFTKVPVDAEFEAKLKADVEAMAKGRADGEVRNLYSVNSRIVHDVVSYLIRQGGYNMAFGSHAGSPVGLYVMGSRASEFNSCIDNTDIPKKIAEIAGYKH